jgi:hypothetical protein
VTLGGTGAADDVRRVPGSGIQDTAELYGVKPVLLEHMPHDVMLDVEWKQAAEAVADWLDAQQL